MVVRRPAMDSNVVLSRVHEATVVDAQSEVDDPDIRLVQVKDLERVRPAEPLAGGQGIQLGADFTGRIGDGVDVHVGVASQQIRNVRLGERGAADPSTQPATVQEPVGGTQVEDDRTVDSGRTEVDVSPDQIRRRDALDEQIDVEGVAGAVVGQESASRCGSGHRRNFLRPGQQSAEAERDVGVHLLDVRHVHHHVARLA